MRRTSSGLLAAALGAAVAWLVVAGRPTGAAEPAQAKTAAPAGAQGPVRGKPAAPDGSAAPVKPGTTPLAKPADPVVSAILASPPSTPAERVRVALALADLNHPELARQQLAEVLKANLDADQVVSLGEELGSAVFVKLAGRTELAPEGRRLADAVLQARVTALRDPARIARWIQELGDVSPEKRTRAMLNLQDAQEAAVGPLLGVLADPKRAAEHPTARAVLVRLGHGAVGPLLATLEAPNPDLAAPALEVLGALQAPETLPLVMAAAFDPAGPEKVRRAAQAALKNFGGGVSAAEAANWLAKQASAYFDGRVPLRVHPNGGVEVWVWDAAQNAPTLKYLTPQGVSLLRAARLARVAHQLRPQDEEIAVLWLASHLELAAYRNGLDNPLPIDKGSPAARAAAAGPEMVERVLRFGMERNHTVAATAAARILGQMPRAEGEWLLCRSPQPAPLVLAARHADRRLRFAAVEAVVRIHPRQGFAGASFVAESLRYLAATTGSPRALVADARLDHSRQIASYLAPLGYQVDLAHSGRELIRRALDCCDYEMLLVDAGIDDPPLGFLLQQLRRDGRTAGLPVGVLARAERFAQADRAAEHDPLAVVLLPPADAKSLHQQVAQVLERAGKDRLSHAERQRQAALALEWLAAWSTDPHLAPLVDCRRTTQVASRAAHVPALSLRAIAVLQQQPTAEAQKALVNLASSPAEPIQTRKAAVAAFAEAARRWGVLLTTEEIQRQYDRYNQSATLDAETQQVLGRILDILEIPAALPASPPPKRTGPAESPSPAAPAGKASSGKGA